MSQKITVSGLENMYCFYKVGKFGVHSECCQKWVSMGEKVIVCVLLYTYIVYLTILNTLTKKQKSNICGLTLWIKYHIMLFFSLFQLMRYKTKYTLTVLKNPTLIFDQGQVLIWMHLATLESDPTEHFTFLMLILKTNILTKIIHWANINITLKILFL